MESGGLIIIQAGAYLMQGTVHLLFSGESRVVGGLRNEKSSHLRVGIPYHIIHVTVQQKTSNIAGIETCSYRDSNICSSLFLIACYYRTYWTRRTGTGKLSDTASRRVFVQ